MTCFASHASRPCRTGNPSVRACPRFWTVHGRQGVSCQCGPCLAPCLCPGERSKYVLTIAYLMQRLRSVQSAAVPGRDWCAPQWSCRPPWGGHRRQSLLLRGDCLLLLCQWAALCRVLYASLRRAGRSPCCRPGCVRFCCARVFGTGCLLADAWVQASLTVAAAMHATLTAFYGEALHADIADCVLSPVPLNPKPQHLSQALDPATLHGPACTPAVAPATTIRRAAAHAPPAKALGLHVPCL